MARRPRVIGKYRIGKRLGTGGFATVYRARDTVEGLNVALKVPHAEFSSPSALHDFQKEIRLTASLEHPNILRLKNAEVYDGQLVVAYPLGEETLEDRLRRRMAVTTCLELIEQMLAALAYAHSRRVIHCDVKPDNLILFPNNRLRLTDFGIARIALRTIPASGSGTVGYVAPEQAMGRPSFRSDVFSAGLVAFRMLAGTLPEWPFTWPLDGTPRVRTKVPRAFVDFLRRAIQVDHRKRFRDGAAMAAAFKRVLPATQRFQSRRRR